MSKEVYVLGGFIFLFYSLIAYVNYYGIETSELPLLILVPMTFVVLILQAFYFWMFFELYRKKTKKKKGLWLFLLIVTLHLGALIFYVKEIRPNLDY